MSSFMDLVSMWLENIFTYEKLYFDFSCIDFALFQGLNGSGKSYFFDSICLGLYGTTPRKKYKNYIRDTPKKCSSGTIKIEFRIDSLYRVERTFGRGKCLHLYKDDKEVELRKPSLIQNEIENIIGMNFDTFLNVCYFSQSDIGKFLTGDSSKRIEIITKIADLISFDMARKSCDYDLKNYELKLKGYKSKLSVYNNIISDIDLKKLSALKKMYETAYDDASKKISEISYTLVSTKEKNELLNDREMLIKDLRNEKDKLEIIRKEYKRNRNHWKLKNIDSKPLIVEIKKINDKLSGAEELTNTIAKLHKKIKKINNFISRYESENNLHEKTIKSLIKATELKGSRCNYCHSLIDDNNVKYLFDNIKLLSNEIESNKLKIEKYEVDIELNEKELRQCQIELKKYDKYYSKIDKIKLKIKDSHDAIIKIGELKKRYNDEKRETVLIIKGLKRKLNNINNDIKDYSEFDTDNIDKLEAQYQTVSYQLHNAESKLKLTKYKIGQHNNAYRKAKRLEAKIKSFDEKFNIIRWWVNNFPIIKLEMINDIIPFIESENNKYLSQILPGKFVKFILDTDKKNNKLDIIITDYNTGVSRPIEGWSGGQKDRMALSVYLALNKLASIKSGKKINFLILDEKFVGVDSINIPQVLSLLSSEKKYRKIMVISHAEKIDGIFNQVVSVKNKNGVTAFNVKDQKVAA